MEENNLTVASLSKQTKLKPIVTLWYNQKTILKIKKSPNFPEIAKFRPDTETKSQKYLAHNGALLMNATNKSILPRVT